ncbi:MAG: polysaccharide export outer membrane protein [Planctomycetaceae bacterium]|jgi:polysaccharide export outer membrane protein
MSNIHHPTMRAALDGLVTAHQFSAGLASLCIATVVLSAPAIADNDAYLSYVEPLQSIQARSYAQSAPRGQDETALDPAEPIALPASIVEREESRLEQIAHEKSGPLNLEETQQEQVLHSDLTQFGYDIFNQVQSAPASALGIPVPTNYLIGPGDNIIVQLYGKRNVEYKLIVTRDGNILVPEYGPIKVAGVTFDEAEQLIAEGFERRVIGAKVVVTMGQLRTVQIRLAGDVTQPGVYTIGGLTTMIDALLTTGGVRPTGTLRNIELIRGGKRIASLDLYGLLLNGRINQDSYLDHNDTIFVPPIGPIVYVGGEVQRPAIYEMKGEKTVGQIIAMAGGLLPTASLKHSHIERIQAAGIRTLIDFSTSSTGSPEHVILGTTVQTGDLLRVLPLEDELEDIILLSGHVKRPGGFQFRPGMRISDVVPSTEALLPGADMDFALVKRENLRTLRTEVVYANLWQALRRPGGHGDIELQSHDQIMVFNLAKDREQVVNDIVRELDIQATHYRPAMVIEVRGALRYTGRLPLEKGARLLDIIDLSGGLKPVTEMYYGVIARTRYPERDVEAIPFKIAAALLDSAAPANLTIESGDRLYFFDDRSNRSELLNSEIARLRQQASYDANERLVTIQGEVLHSGTYPLAQSMRASDLLCAARGLTRKAYGLTTELSRIQHNATSSNKVEHTTLDSLKLLSLCELTRQAASGRINVTDNNELLALYVDEHVNPTLAPMDQLTFTEKSGWVEGATVTLFGEVQRPGVYAIDRGETLCEVLQRAVGLTPEAYIFGSKFTRESVRAMQQETLDELQDQLDDLMIELSLSHSFNNRDKTSHDWAGRQDYIKTIRQLESAEANGRMVINLEHVLKCRKGDQLALEDGDTLTIPHTPDYVQVSGQVYVPTSHLYDEDRKIGDYVELSGGHTVLGRLKDTFVIQANGEVLNYKGSRTSSRIARKTVMPGARIYVPLDVDRMNGTEKAQSWISSLMQSAILAGLLL